MSFMNNILRFRNPTKATSDADDVVAPLNGDGNNSAGGSKRRLKANPCGIKLIYLLIALICFILALILKWWFRDSDIVWATRGVVVCDDRRCSKVGASMLKRGGHAVDAAIATSLCNGVVSPTESGIGGGGFMVVREAKTGEVSVYDMRETAPAGASKYMYERYPLHPIDQFYGPKAMAVPGQLKGFYEAWRKHGKLPWKTLFEPAIHYAKRGFEVLPFLAQDLQDYKVNVTADPGLKGVFAPNGVVLKKGETCYNIKLGETLETIALYGPDVFYNGFIGEKLISELKGAIITMDDLRNYTVSKPKILETDIINGYKIIGMPPPTTGFVSLAMVTNVLSNYGSTFALEESIGMHRYIEALKHMLGIRMNLGDPAFDRNTTNVVNEMISETFANQIWKRIDDTKTFPREYYEDSWKQIIDGGTSHQSVVDKNRNAVALTQSLNDVFGAKVMSPTTGIIINNQMGDFSTPTEIGRPAFLKEPHANLIAPGKRPLSSMSPIIILKDGELAGVIGGSGGPKIMASVSQVFLNYFILGMDPLAAVQTTRVFPKLADDGDLDYEDSTMFNGQHIELPKYERTFLEGRGHELSLLTFEPVCHLIVQTKWWGMSILAAAADLRKDAKPAAA